MSLDFVWGVMTVEEGCQIFLAKFPVCFGTAHSRHRRHHDAHIIYIHICTICWESLVFIRNSLTVEQYETEILRDTRN